MGVLRKPSGHCAGRARSLTQEAAVRLENTDFDNELKKTICRAEQNLYSAFLFQPIRGEPSAGRPQNRYCWPNPIAMSDSSVER